MAVQPAPSAARWSYAARVMAAHLADVIRYQRSQPGGLAEGPHRSMNDFFSTALDGLTRSVPHCTDQTLALARDALQHVLDPPPRSDDALYDRLRAYAYIMSRLPVLTELTPIEVRDTRELFAFLQHLGRDDVRGAPDHHATTHDDHAPLDG